MAEGKFPAPIRLTAKAVGWLEAEVAAWVAARVAERDAPKEGAAHGDSRSQALNAAPAGADGRKTRAPALKRRAEAAS